MKHKKILIGLFVSVFAFSVYGCVNKKNDPSKLETEVTQSAKRTFVLPKLPKA